MTREAIERIISRLKRPATLPPTETKPVETSAEGARRRQAAHDQHVREIGLAAYLATKRALGG